MKPPLPIWSIPFMLALIGLIALVGQLDSILVLVVGVETLLFAGYLVLRSRAQSSDYQPSTNVLSLFPGHLLVLLIIALLDDPSFLAWLWTIIPLSTVAYDAASRSATLPSVVRISISMILYGILWADLFFVLERAIVLHRHLSGKAEIMIAAGFAVAGTLFIALGVYRHWMTAKE